MAKEDILVEMINGRQVKAKWASEFNPADKAIVVSLSGREDKLVIDLVRVCCILMAEPPLADLIVGEDDPREIIECVTGTSYSVHSLKVHQKEGGFFAMLVEQNVPYPVIYFTNGGVRCRKNYMPVGRILEKQGVLSKEDLDKALAEQQHLKKRRLGEIISQEHQLGQDTIDEVVTQAQKEGMTGKWLRVGDILVEAGLVTREQVEKALASQEDGKKKKIGRLLVERGLVSEEQVLAALATKFHLPFIDLREFKPDPHVLAMFSADLVMQLQVFPLADRGDYLEVATSRPTEPGISDSLRFHTNRRIQMVTATPEQIRYCIDKYYVTDDDLLQSLSVNPNEEDASQGDVGEAAINEPDSETIRLANKILIDAYRQGASDIHLEPGTSRQPMGIRYRIDGICRNTQMLPPRFAKPLVARMKILASLDIAEHRRAQSGKILLQFQGNKIEYRLEITPTVGGVEDAVLRILDDSKRLALEELELSATNLREMQALVAKPNGIILCVGPTGSGKTTTLHAALGAINTPERKILTVEDPVEITQPGLRQIEVNTKIGRTFHEALRSILRADPDVVMIGEMRDREGARTAIESSLTGHLVFSTLHTNNASETVTRLLEMGEEPFNLADALLGILAQRLTRRLCHLCRESYHPSEEEYEHLVDLYGRELFAAHGHPEYNEALELVRGVGCEECADSGYKGRVAIHELLLCSDQVRRIIKTGGSAADIQEVAVSEGMRTLRMDGIEKVLAGLTDLTQIQRVCL